MLLWKIFGTWKEFPIFSKTFTVFQNCVRFRKINCILFWKISCFVKFSQFKVMLKDTHFWNILWIYNTCSRSKKCSQILSMWNLKDVPISKNSCFSKSVHNFQQKTIQDLKMVHVSYNIQKLRTLKSHRLKRKVD